MKALLIGVNLGDEKYTKNSLNELKKLCLTINIEAFDTVIQKRKEISNNYYIGKGKALEINKIISMFNLDYIIFDDSLTPRQMKNLSEIIECEIMDRCFLVLKIFEQNAKTRQAKLELELAKSKYILPRLFDKTKEISKSGGGIGAKGEGETKLELLRRQTHNKISKIKKELEEIYSHNEISNNLISSKNIPIVSIIGYTNAGKSSLFNYLCNNFLASEKGINVETGDKLFLTLDCNKCLVKNKDMPPFLLVDTIGFMDKLPLEILSSFRTTFLNIQKSDVIIEVIDGETNDNESIYINKMILENLADNNSIIITVVSKSDLNKKNNFDFDYINISSKTGENIDVLLQNIYYNIYNQNKVITLLIPFTNLNIYSNIKNKFQIINETYLDNGIKIKVCLDNKHLNLYQKYVTETTY